MSQSSESLNRVIKRLETSSSTEAAIQAIAALQLLTDLLSQDLSNLRAKPDSSNYSIYLIDELASEIDLGLLKFVCVLIAADILDPLTTARLLMEITPEGFDRQLMYEAIVDDQYQVYFGIQVLATIMEEYGVQEPGYLKGVAAVSQFYPFEPRAFNDELEESDELDEDSDDDDWDDEDDWYDQEM